MKNFFLILFICPVLTAQDSVYILQPVEVTGERPINNFQSFDVIEGKDVQYFNPGVSLEETFSKIPGIIINDRNNPSLGDRISIRGIGSRSSFGIRGIKILTDNIPLTLPDGQSQTNNIDLFSSGRIDILKGPASSYYGNASGGVINFRTELPDKETFNITPEIMFGSYGLKKYSLKFSGQQGVHAYTLSLNNLNYTGFREHSSRKTYQLNTVYKSIFSDHINFKAVINYFNSPYLLNPGALNKESLHINRNSAREFNKLQGAGEKADQFQSGLIFNLHHNNFNFEATLYFVKRNLINPIPGRIIKLNRSVLGLRSFINKKFISNNYEFDISGGIDVEFQNDLRNEFENNGLPHTNFKPDEIFANLGYGNKLIDQNENVTGIGPFLSLKLMANKVWGIISAIRYDHYLFQVDDFYTNNSAKRYMNQFSPSAGIIFNPESNLKLYLNYSTSFQTPTTSELSNKPDAVGGFNPDLNPEIIYQFEFGGEYFLIGFNNSITGSVYYLNFTDLILPYQISGSEEVFFRNAGRAENVGAEILIENRLLNELSFSAAYSIMDFIFKDYVIEFSNGTYLLEGNRIPGVPQHKFYFSINFENETGLESMLRLNFTDGYYTNDFNGQPPGDESSNNNFFNESYFKADFRIGYNLFFDIINMKIFLGINNLFNSDYNGSVVPNALGYRYFEPAPERNWFAGLRISY